MQQTFSGVIFGTTAFHHDSALVLAPNQIVYVTKIPDGQVEFAMEPGEKTLCALAWNPKNQSYTVQPIAQRAVFLETGQPLGRFAYDLPRRTGLYFVERKNLVVLG